MTELKDLLNDRNKVATIVAVLGALATIVSALGTAVASVILAMNNRQG